MTPSYASSFDAEIQRTGSEVLFGSMTPEEAAQAVMDVLEGYGE